MFVMSKSTKSFTSEIKFYWVTILETPFGLQIFSVQPFIALANTYSVTFSLLLRAGYGPSHKM